MTHVLNSDKWLGYASLVGVGWVVFAMRLATEPVFVTATACVAVLGLICGVRGVFIGGKLSRWCAVLSLPFWVWLIYSLVLALARAKSR